MKEYKIALIYLISALLGFVLFHWTLSQQGLNIILIIIMPIEIFLSVVSMSMAFNHLGRLFKYLKLRKGSHIIEWTYDKNSWSEYVFKETKRRFHEGMRNLIKSLLVIPFIIFIIIVVYFYHISKGNYDTADRFITPFSMKIYIYFFLLAFFILLIGYPIRALVFFVENIHSQTPWLLAGNNYVLLNGEFHQWKKNKHGCSGGAKFINDNIMEIKYNASASIRILIPEGKGAQAVKLLNIINN